MPHTQPGPLAIDGADPQGWLDCASPEHFRRQTEVILNAAGEGIYGLDLDGRVTFANPAAAQMTGHSVAELMGEHMHFLVHHTARDGRRTPREQCAIYAALADGAVHRVESDLFWRKDGTSFPVAYASTPIAHGDRLVGAVVVFQDISARERSESQLRGALAEVQRLKERLQEENAYLRQEISAARGCDSIVGESTALRAVLNAAELVARTGTTVLIQGESGTGKELVARAIHGMSPRADRPLVKVNCGALPSSLIESELFGHEKGAFTGALAQRRGRFELADGGSLLLDEVGELPLATQASLLRVLQDGEFERVGGVATRRVDVRVIAATNRDLASMVEAGGFRADLYYRLNVFPIRMPPLRERMEDLPALIAAALAKLAKRLGRPISGLSAQSLRRLHDYSYPGNVRELHNLLERAAILQTTALIEVEPLGLPSAAAASHQAGSHSARATGSPALRPGQPGSHDLQAHEREHITAVLAAARWKIAGDDGAAAALGLHPNTLRSRMKRLGIPTRSETRHGLGQFGQAPRGSA
jgi:formate hydrogenlyase transcriptional activator